MELRTIQDWIVRRQLLGVPGLAEVNSLGGEVKQYQVLVDPDRLAGYGLTLRDVFDATASASGTSGGGVIETGPEQLSVRSVGLVQTLDDLRNTTIRTSDGGVPVRLGDVAEVEIGPAIRFGAATEDGGGEVVTGFTMQLKGANARVVVSAVKDRIEEIQATLPEGVVIKPYYDRTDLVGRTIATVGRNLGEGAVLVIVVLLLLLAHLRAGLILASTIPLAMLFAIICMVLTKQTGNLMSLGAIDFGLVVDGSLIIVENVLRLIKKRQDDGAPIADDEGMRRLVYSGAAEMVKSAKFGVFIIILVYLPIMTLQGIEGKLFRPMALTVTFALIGSLILSVTYVPVMCSLFLKGKKPIKESRIIEFLHHRYRPVLTRALGSGKVVVGTTVAALAVALFVFTRLGGEFLPRLDEGDFAVQIIRLPSVSLTRVARDHVRGRAPRHGLPRGRDDGVEHGPRRDLDRPDGRRDRGRLRDPQGPLGMARGRRPRADEGGADRGRLRGARRRAGRRRAVPAADRDAHERAHRGRPRRRGGPDLRRGLRRPQPGRGADRDDPPADRGRHRRRGRADVGLPAARRPARPRSAVARRRAGAGREPARRDGRRRDQGRRGVRGRAAVRHRRPLRGRLARQRRRAPWHPRADGLGRARSARLARRV